MRIEKRLPHENAAALLHYSLKTAVITEEKQVMQHQIRDVQLSCVPV